MGSNKKICIITGGHLATNPRVLKESNFLCDLGYNVEVLTIWRDAALLIEDRSLLRESIEYSGVDLCRTNSKKLLPQRIGQKIGALLVRHCGIQSILALGYGLSELLRLVRNSPADLYICHQETGLYVGTALLREKRAVAFDFEDWYSEDLPKTARRERPVKLLKRMEAIALNQGLYVTTTSEAQAQALSAHYYSPKPLVLRNAFDPIEPSAATPDTGQPLRILWFSQTIGPYRGIELLAEALRLTAELAVEVHLLGTLSGRYDEQLKHLFAQRPHQRLHVHERVSNQQLPYFIAQHDVGVALEFDHPQNKNYTISNKILQYLQAGIAVVATRTAGQVEIAESAPDAVHIIEQHDAVALANRLQELAQDRARLSAAKAASRKAGLEIFNWSNESRVLLQALQKLDNSIPQCV